MQGAWRGALCEECEGGSPGKENARAVEGRKERRGEGGKKENNRETGQQLI